MYVRELLEKHNILSNGDIHWTLRAADASKMKQIKTLRQGLIETLEQELRPALAAVIACIDPHRNLKLLDSDNWQVKKLWLELFQFSHEIDLKFDKGLPSSIKMFHVGDESEMMFDAAFPFSWVVKKAVENCMTCCAHDDGADPYDGKLSKKFHNGPIGRLLAEVTADQNVKLIQSYLHDFIYLSHDFKPAPGEFEIIERLIMTDLVENFPEDYGIPQIHIAHERAQMDKHCLTNMAAVLNLEPEIAFIVKEAVLTSLSVENVDMIALRALIQHLNGVALNDLLSNSELWISKVDQCKSLTEAIIGDKMSNIQVSEKYRLKWPILELIRMYVSFVIVPSTPHPAYGRRPHQLPYLITNVGEYHKKKAFGDIVGKLRTILSYQRLKTKQCSSKEEEFREISYLINRFFMAFVCSDLVFPSSQICPDPEVLEWLSKFVTFRSQPKFDLLECDVSTNSSSALLYADPVMLKCYFRHVDHPNMRRHLDVFISGLDQRCTKPENYLQALRTIIQYCHQEPMKLVPICTESEVDGKMNDYLQKKSKWTKLSLEAVQTVSDIQMMVTSCVDKIYQMSATVPLESKEISKLLRITSTAGDLQPGYLATRKILSVYGESFAMDFIDSPDNFVIPESCRQGFPPYAVTDKFEVYKDHAYLDAKHWLIQLSQKTGVTKDEIHQCIGNDTAAILKAIFTTSLWKHELRMTVEMLENLVAAMARERKHVNLFLQRLLNTDEWPTELDVNRAKGALISMLVLQMFNSAANCNPCYDNFPFHRIITEPERAVKDLLPTMPNGPLDNLMRQFGVQQQTVEDVGHLSVHVCQSGHLFISKQKGAKHCSTCKLASDDGGNGKEDGTRRQMAFSALLGEIGAGKSKSGHILGTVNTRPKTPKGIRQLSPLSCAVVRCLTHLSMLTSSLLYPKKVVEIIQPTLTSNEAISFLDEHIWRDLLQISECCGESVENCILLLEHILYQLGQAHENKSPLDMANVTEREKWEEMFAEEYVQSTFEKKDMIIHVLKHQMNTHVGNQCSQWLKELLSANVESATGQSLFMDQTLWEYGEVPTIECLHSKLRDAVQVHPAISALIKNHEVLWELKHLPDILKLARIMSEKFHGKLSRLDASKQKMGCFIKKHINEFQASKEELMHLVENYVSAWNACALSSHVGFADAFKISEDSTVLEFLLDKDNILMCNTLNLIICLKDAQNHMLSLMTLKGAKRESSMFSKPLELPKVTPFQLLNVPCKDVIHQFLSNMHQCCVDGSIDLVASIQSSALSDIVGSSRQLAVTIDDLPFYKFEDDFQLWKQIEVLSHDQEKLLKELQTSILHSAHLNKELLSKDIKVLEIVINYLFTMHQYKPEMKFCDLMAMLCMNNPSYLGKEGSNTRKCVKVKHVLHIWLLLKYSQANLFMKQHQEEHPFDDIHENYLDKVPTNIKGLVSSKFEPRHYITGEFLVHLFEFIILRLNKGISRSGAKFEDPNKQLDDALRQFLRRQNLADYYAIEETLPVLPCQLLVSHSAYLWFLAWKRFDTL